MTLGPIPDYLKRGMRRGFLTDLKNNHSLDTYELDLFRWFKDETEAAWTHMNSEEQKYVQEQVDSGADEINDSGVLATDYYRRRMRASHVLFLASLLERAMKQECERVTHTFSAKVLFKPSELKGDPWSARRTFLERHGSFNIPNDLWGPILDLLNVRNALAHHSGELSLLTREEVSRLQKIPGISVNTSEIGIEINYLDYVSKAVQDVMEFLHARTNELIDRAIAPKAIT